VLIVGVDVGKTVLIGNARVTVVSQKGTRIQLGIEAPRDVFIIREDLLLKEQAEDRNETSEEVND
jgi:carbon storage regulator CsrA